jgi:hypothetical protein
MVRGGVRGALVATIVSAAASTPAQDSHYWTSQFGNRARLLGGAVIGSVDDLSAVYYNPGALGLVKKPELLLSGSVLQQTTIKMEDGLGEGQDLVSSTLKVVPSLFAGEIRLGFLGKHRLAYSFLARQGFDAHIEERAAFVGENVFAVPGLELAAASVRADARLSENWVGLTWASPVGEGLGLGLSQFLAVRSQSLGVQTLAQGLGTGGRAVASIQSRDFEYQHWRLFWKLGLGLERERWKLGLTVTTPGVSLGGSGSAGLDRTAVGQDIERDGRPVTEVTTDFQDGVVSEFRSPLSIGLGAAYGTGKTRIHAAAEWFGAIDEYLILDTAPFVSQSSGQPFASDVLHQLDSVLNLGVGVQHRFSPTLEGYASFRTDVSGAVPDSDANASVSAWDLHHVSTGASFSLGRSDFTLGGILAFGKENSGRGVTLLRDDGTGDGVTLSENARVRFFRLTLVFGFNVAFD